MKNPLIKAVRAAIKELSTPEAIDWYQEMAILTVINTVKFTMTVTAFCCDLVETWLLEPQEMPADAPSGEYDLIDLALPATRIAGLLMPAKEVVKVARVLVTPAATFERVLITPPNVVYNLVKAILPTAQYSGGGALTSYQGKMALYRH